MKFIGFFYGIYETDKSVVRGENMLIHGGGSDGMVFTKDGPIHDKLLWTNFLGVPSLVS